MAARDENEALQDLRYQCKKFRICIIGKTGVGKSTLLSRVFGVSAKEAGVRSSSEGCGKHNIWTPITNDEQNSSLIIHDSGGFEAGESDTVAEVMKFIEHRRQQPHLVDQLHCIWYCISLSDSRPIQAADEEFFRYARTLEIPLIFVLTKFDRLVRDHADDLDDDCERSVAARAVGLARRDVESFRSKLEDATGNGVKVQEVSRKEGSLVQKLVTGTTSIVDRNLIHVWIRAQGFLASQKREECVKELPFFIRNVMIANAIPLHPLRGVVLSEHFKDMFYSCLTIWNIPGQSLVFTNQYVDNSFRKASQSRNVLTGIVATLDFTGPLTAPIYVRLALKMAVDLILIFQLLFWHLRIKRQKALWKGDLDQQLAKYKNSEIRTTVHGMIDGSVGALSFVTAFSVSSVREILGRTVEHGQKLVREEIRRSAGPNDGLPLSELEG
ncbi:hypothetical protein K440DRAFT_663467 [Wilcoxina mikolae CBS 423.85]|nr:hypothetical protein K440DRAFT_663467 [Wilcoxina mikolae CBS 423.85]